jgi:hypothetical protein
LKDSSFPSMKEGEDMTKGGITVVKIQKSSPEAAPVFKLKWECGVMKKTNEWHFRTTYYDRNNKKYEDNEEFVIPEEAEKASGDYFQDTSIRKAVLLVRYVNFMKNYLENAKKTQKNRPMGMVKRGIFPGVTMKVPPAQDEQQVTAQNEETKESFKKFIDYFEREMEAVDDRMLDRELQNLISVSQTLP